MIPARRIAATALVAAGLIATGAASASAAPAERISTTSQLQAHLAKAIALDAPNATADFGNQTPGKQLD